MANTGKTFLLLAFLTAVLVYAGGALGGQSGMTMMLVFSALMNLGVWFFSDSIAIRTSGAVPLPEGRLDWLRADLAELSDRAGIPTPSLYWVPHEHSPNAFATGRSPSKGVVAVTAGLLELLDREQVKGVLAHELGHIKHRDTLVSSVAATMAGALTFVSRMAMWGGMGGGRRREGNPLLGLAVMILAPIAALLVRMAISRTREYMADERAANLTGNPEALASALEALKFGVARRPQTVGSESTHYIVHGFSGGMAGLFSTHPPIEERAKRLRALSKRRY